MADYRGEKPAIGDELVIKATPGELLDEFATRAVKECREYGGAASATFNGSTIHIGTGWEAPTVARMLERELLEARPAPARGRFPDKSPLPTDNNDPRADYGTWQKPTEAPRLNVLAEAARVVSGDRQRDYGNPADNHQATADFFNAYLRRRYGADAPALDVRAVCVLNMLQKISRDANRPKRDNLVDIAGYARNIEMADEADE